MSDLSKIPTSQLRAAASAWRYHQMKGYLHYQASGFFKWFMSPPNMSLHDQIDKMIDEIERLRK